MPGTNRSRGAQDTVDLGRKTRKKYTALEERRMWYFFARELRAGNEDALRRRPRLWGVYERTEQTDKKMWGLESHFRKQMQPHIHHASINREDLFLLLRFFKVGLNRQQREFLEQKFDCDVECEADGSFIRARLQIGEHEYTLPTAEEEETIIRSADEADDDDRSRSEESSAEKTGANGRNQQQPANRRNVQTKQQHRAALLQRNENDFDRQNSITSQQVPLNQRPTGSNSANATTTSGALGLARLFARDKEMPQHRTRHSMRAVLVSGSPIRPIDHSTPKPATNATVNSVLPEEVSSTQAGTTPPSPARSIISAEDSDRRNPSAEHTAHEDDNDADDGDILFMDEVVLNGTDGQSPVKKKSTELLGNGGADFDSPPVKTVRIDDENFSPQQSRIRENSVEMEEDGTEKARGDKMTQELKRHFVEGALGVLEGGCCLQTFKDPFKILLGGKYETYADCLDWLVDESGASGTASQQTQMAIK